MNRLMTELELSPQTLLGKSIYVTGKSKKGKTTAIEDILFALRRAVATAYVFCATNPQNGLYSGRSSVTVSNFAIFTEMRVAHLEQIYQHQERISTCWNLAHDAQVLSRILSLLGQSDASVAAKLDGIMARAAAAIDADAKLNDSKKALLKRQLRETHGSRRVELMREAIRNSGAPIGTLKPDWPRPEQQALMYFDVNPECVVLIDDMTENLKSLQKEPIFVQLLTKGRHQHITLIFATHDIKAISVALRNASNLTIMMDPVSIDEYFAEASGERRRAVVLRREAIHPRGEFNISGPRLVWDGEHGEFRQLVIRFHDPFRFPENKALWDYYDSVEARLKSGAED